ncbi:MAG TPA: hypothetical protein IAC73_02045 [Candidatus Limadaptatus stercoripullorum]|uniref:Uncharacterized protein n=1 Tax=Candidatus Limadaptatus stercoripullorum TaxID=2840846 RepID=A0A9D1N9K7_9FIRM|nr:hypothetical protein [Candidatus Limadaptatus stercoripullorum]
MLSAGLSRPNFVLSRPSAAAMRESSFFAGARPAASPAAKSAAAHKAGAPEVKRCAWTSNSPPAAVTPAKSSTAPVAPSRLPTAREGSAAAAPSASAPAAAANSAAGVI